MSIFGINLFDYEKRLVNTIATLSNQGEYSFNLLSNMTKCSKRSLSGSIIEFSGRFESRIGPDSADGILGSVIYRTPSGYKGFCDIVVEKGNLILLHVDSTETIKKESIVFEKFLLFENWRLAGILDLPGIRDKFDSQPKLNNLLRNQYVSYYTNRYLVEESFTKFITETPVITTPHYEIDVFQVNMWYWHPFSEIYPHSLLSFAFSADNDILLSIGTEFKNNDFWLSNQSTEELILRTKDFGHALEEFIRLSSLKAEYR